jgi:hypothetical protein
LGDHAYGERKKQKKDVCVITNDLGCFIHKPIISQKPEDTFFHRVDNEEEFVCKKIDKYGVNRFSILKNRSSISIEVKKDGYITGCETIDTTLEDLIILRNMLAEIIQKNNGVCD